MNSDLPTPSPQEELEAQITALLLGELSENEARALREKIAGDPELVKLHRELGLAMGLVKEALASPEPVEMTAPEGLKLSEERREKLLASFKVTAPVEFQERSVVRSWVALAAMIVCLFMLAGMFMPALSKAKSKAKRVTWMPTGPEEVAVQAQMEDSLAEQDREAKTVTLTVDDLQARSAPAKTAESLIRRESLSGARGRDETSARAYMAEGRKLSEQRETQLGQRVRIELPSSEATQPADPQMAAGGVPFGSAQAKPANQEFETFGFPNANQPQRDGPASSFERGVNLGGVAGGFGGGGLQATRGFSGSEGMNLGFAVKNETALGVNNNWAAPSTIEVEKQWAGVLEKPASAPAVKNPFVGRYSSSEVANAPADLNKLAAVDSLSTATRGQAGATAFDSDFAKVPEQAGKELAEQEAVRRNATMIEERARESRAKSQEMAARELSSAAGSASTLAQPSERPSATPATPALTAPPMMSAGQEPYARYRSGGRPMLGAPLATPSNADSKKLADSRGDNVAQLSDGVADMAGADATKGKDAGLPGGAGMSMQYYMSNPELMKRSAVNLPPTSSTTATSSIDPLTGLPASGEPVVAGRMIDPLTGLTAENKEALLAQFSRQVETEKQLRESIAARIEQEKGEKRDSVRFLDRAEASSDKKPSLLERFGRTSERVAKLEIPVPTQPRNTGAEVRGGAAYDPYFLQSEFEIVKSQDVLSDVAEKLNLGERWADQKGDGTTLSKGRTTEILRQMVEVRTPKAGEMDIAVRSGKPVEAALIANTIAEVYQQKRQQIQRATGAVALQEELAKQDEKLVAAKQELELLRREVKGEPAATKPVSVAGVPQPEVATAGNAFSTFSLNVSDVSFKLAAASLEKGLMPDVATVRSEEFINAFDYRDPAAVGSAPVAFAWERARYPFAHDRDLLRFSVKTAASGREAGRPLNLVLLLDNSGSMERADRVRIIQECLRVLTGQLQAQDKISVVTFARTARLQVDGLAGNAAKELPARVGEFTPEGGTNLEEAMRVAYETAAKHFLTTGVNRVVLLTDGAANLGDVKAESLKQNAEAKRKTGIALDCFGIGWEGLNDDLLEQLSRNGDGRYGFVNTPEAASAEFAGQLAGALKVAASDVKVQVEFNPKRTTVYRQIGYAKHQLTKEQFRDNTVDAAEIGAAEAGNALYLAQVNPAGEGPIGTVRVRFKVPGTNDYREHEWAVPYEGASKALEQASPAMRLAGAASSFSEWLVASPYAGEVTLDRLLGLMANVPEAFANDGRPKQLEWMIRQAKSVAGK